MAKKPIPIPIVPIEEPKQEEPPKCPPVGAPAWMATFADIAILLMAFFVLILSFAEFNQPKFKMIAGSLRESFGVQRDIPVVEQPRGTTVLELKFSPSQEPSISKTITQDTTTTEQPKIRSDVSDQQKRADHDQKQESDQNQKSEEEKREEMRRELAELLKKALQQGELTAKVEGEQVVLDYEPSSDTPGSLDQAGMNNEFQQQNGSEDRMGQKMGSDDQQDGMPQIDPLTGLPRNGDSGGMPQDTLSNGLPQMAEMDTANPSQELSEEELMAELIQKLNDVAQNALEADTDGDGAAEGAANHPEGIDGESKAAIASDKLAVALRRELGEGLVQVEQRDGKVFVTVGAGGAFPSGTADLTQDARDIMDRIAFAAMNEASSITVTGHTDDVPLSAGSQFRDNWGLAAARSASVVRELAGSGLIDPTQLTATSMGESQPVADNSTVEGREQNRRIEIEISY
ncbi:OmpA family protein [Thalassobius sp. MITS945101]|uniref:OmpA family protein n=1 Tax=Thalassobius sp. MITS945101 TaxID=3096994 RepID=UPI00399B534A